MKRVLWILGTGMVCILYCFLVGIVLMVGNIVTSIATRTEMRTLNQDVFNIVALIGWGILIILSIWMYQRWKMKCHACKRWKALNLIHTETLKKENISVKMELEHRNLRGDVTGTHEQYIPGKRITHQDTYKCKYCGNFETRVRTEKKASI